MQDQEEARRPHEAEDKSRGPKLKVKVPDYENNPHNAKQPRSPRVCHGNLNKVKTPPPPYRPPNIGGSPNDVGAREFEQDLAHNMFRIEHMDLIQENSLYHAFWRAGQEEARWRKEAQGGYAEAKVPLP